MEPFRKTLESGFAQLHQSLRQLSDHWRTHTNRRTIVILLVGGTLTALLYLFVIQPPDTFPTDQLVSIDQGQTVSQIANTLHQDGVIRSPLAFRVLVTLLRSQKQLHAGDYLFKQPEDVFTITHAISVGAYGLEPLRIRVPEGANTKQMALIFVQQLQRFDPQAFLTKAAPMEGYLFPDTYFFLPNATADTVISAMRQNFDTQIATLSPQIASSTHSLSDIVKMASIVEREARTDLDRQMIAGVLWRRIKLGMPLQTDVAFSYIGIDPSQLTTAQLQSSSAYNTYTHKGLPPTPIDSPSLSSLQAAIDPIDKGYLFYLADRNGVTHYCKTYACQLANERKYLGK